MGVSSVKAQGQPASRKLRSSLHAEQRLFMADTVTLEPPKHMPQPASGCQQPVVRRLQDAHGRLTHIPKLP